MIVYAAIDLRAGQAVQLVGGQPDAQRIALPNPAQVAQGWIDAGFQALHVVDLDAALGTGHNRVAIAEILQVATIPVQVGGGVRDEDAVAALLEAGAARIMVATRALEDPVWLMSLAEKYPRRIIVAADVRGTRVVTRGWTAETARTVEAVLETLGAAPIAAVLITDVVREGQLVGIDAAKFTTLVQATALPVIAAGGIRDLADLHALELAGVAGAVLGMSLYTGSIDARAVVAEFA